MFTRHVLRLSVVLAAVLMLSGCQSNPPPADAPCYRETPVPFSLQAASDFEQEVVVPFVNRQRGPFHVDITSSEITSFIQDKIRGSPFKSPTIWFGDGYLCLDTVYAVLGPLHTRLTVQITARLDADQVRFSVDYLRLGRWQAPSRVRHYLTRILNETIRDAQWRVRITDLELKLDHLIITGQW